MTYDQIRRLALTLPNVQEGTSYGTPALKVKGNLFVRLRPDLDSIVLRTTFDQRDHLIEEDPQTFYITDHYRDYPWTLVRLSKTTPEAMRDLLRMSHAAAQRAKSESTKSKSGS